MEDKQNTYEERKEIIYDLIKNNKRKTLTTKAIIELLQVPKTDFDEFYAIINELCSEGLIVRGEKGKLFRPEDLDLVAGTFIANSKGFGFVVVEDMDVDIFIPRDHTQGAMHKDKVLCKIRKEQKLNKRQEGEIVAVLSKGMNTIVGTYHKNKSFGFVVPDDSKVNYDIFILKSNENGAVTGHKVVVELTKPPKDGQKPEGKIKEILGHENDPGVDILSIVHQLEIPTTFPPEVYTQIENIPSEVNEKELQDRIDMRSVTTVTIDGEDAKDLDDAISLTHLEDGNYLLSVHIADVTHYVREGSPLDQEALLRGTSVYLADRVIPMLPHKLSNGICSLNATVDRLALSCDMTIDNTGKVLSSKIYNSVINVDKRMSYTEVNSLLTDPTSSYLDDANQQLMPLFHDMQSLATILRNKRVERGAIDFDFPESKVVLNELGKVIDIKKYERNIATNIIEELMLVTNETIAEHYFWLETPFVYRSHAEPDEEKMEKLKDFLQGFGYYLKGKTNHPKSIQKLLSSVEKTPEEAVISRFVLRSMKQARYTPKNEGHFGLAAQYYCHFTSPIRRYPDLQIHRIIKEHLADQLTESRVSKLNNILPDVCKDCSTNERRAEEAERETIKLKKVEYMEDKIGNTYTGTISGVTPWGIYVELDNTVEGMVSNQTLSDDYYVFDDTNLKYVGSKTNKTYSIGQSVTVKVTKADKQNRKLDFEFVI